MFRSYFLYAITLGLNVSLEFRRSRKGSENRHSVATEFYDNVTIVASVYNEESRIVPFLLSFDRRANLLIVDNFSDDFTVDLIKKYRPDTKIIKIKNQGSPSAEGIKESHQHVTTEWIISTGINERYPTDLLNAIHQVMTNYPECVAISVPRLTITQGKITHRSLTSLHKESLFSRPGGPTQTELTFGVMKPKSWDMDRSRIHRELPVKPNHHYFVLNQMLDKVHMLQNRGFPTWHEEMSKLDRYLALEKRKTKPVTIKLVPVFFYVLRALIAHILTLSLTRPALVVIAKQVAFRLRSNNY